MKKYFININNSESTPEVEISEKEILFPDNSKTDYQYRFINDELLLVRINNKNFLFKSEGSIESNIKNTEFVLEYNSKYYNLICKNELELLTEKFSKNGSSSRIKNELLSPMPGAVVKINVKEGDVVKKGTVLVVLEAMKMENELKALSDCKVQKILVEEKMSVDKNHLLMKFEI